MVKLLLWLLKLKKITTTDKALILNTLIESIGAIPTQSIITFDLDGTITINGKTLTPEQTISLREGAVNLTKNWTYKVMEEQIAWEAVKYGVHASTTTDMLLLSKAVLWTQQQRKKIISDLTGEINS